MPVSCAFVAPCALHVAKPTSALSARSCTSRSNIVARPRYMSACLKPGRPPAPPFALLTDTEDDANEEKALLHRVHPPAPGLASRAAPLDARVLFAEFLSTFIFVYVSVTAAGRDITTPSALTNGALIAAVASSFMAVSGAHLNPAVTAALLITRRVSFTRAAAFVPAQLAAAALASYAVSALGVPVSFAGIASDASFKQLVHAFADEMVPMAIIVFVVFQTAVATPEEGGVGTALAAVYIGLAVLSCAASFGAAVFNPARAFGPALVAQNFHAHWIYWLAPIVGALAAALISEHLFIAPAVGRNPNSWLQVGCARINSLRDRVRALGLASLIAYGIINTILYPTVMAVVLFSGGSITSSSVASATLVAWAFVQATLPIRLIITITAAPCIHRWLRKWRSSRKSSDGKNHLQ